MHNRFLPSVVLEFLPVSMKLVFLRFPRFILGIGPIFTKVLFVHGLNLHSRKKQSFWRWCKQSALTSNQSINQTFKRDQKCNYDNVSNESEWNISGQENALKGIARGLFIDYLLWRPTYPEERVNCERFSKVLLDPEEKKERRIWREDGAPHRRRWCRPIKQRSPEIKSGELIMSVMKVLPCCYCWLFWYKFFFYMHA